MGLTAFNRMRRQQEAMKKAKTIKPEEIEQVLKTLEVLNPSKETVDTVVKALKSGAVYVQDAFKQIEEEVSKIELEKRNKEEADLLKASESASVGDEPATETATQEEATQMIESGEAEIPAEAVVEEIAVNDEPAVEEAPVETSSKKKNSKKNS